MHIDPTATRVAHNAEAFAKHLLATGADPDNVISAFLEIALVMVEKTRGRPMVATMLARALDIETRLVGADQNIGHA